MLLLLGICLLHLVWYRSYLLVLQYKNKHNTIYDIYCFSISVHYHTRPILMARRIHHLDYNFIYILHKSEMYLPTYIYVGNGKASSWRSRTGYKPDNHTNFRFIFLDTTSKTMRTPMYLGCFNDRPMLICVLNIR